MSIPPNCKPARISRGGNTWLRSPDMTEVRSSRGSTMKERRVFTGHSVTGLIHHVPIYNMTSKHVPSRILRNKAQQAKLHMQNPISLSVSPSRLLLTFLISNGTRFLHQLHAQLSEQDRRKRRTSSSSSSSSASPPSQSSSSGLCSPFARVLVSSLLRASVRPLVDSWIR